MSDRKAAAIYSPELREVDLDEGGYERVAATLTERDAMAVAYRPGALYAVPVRPPVPAEA